MQKRLVSIFFISIFTIFLALPLTICIVEKDYNISAFFNVNEEEHSKNGLEKIIELKLISSDKFNFSSLQTEKEKRYCNYNNNYSEFYIECFSPPPEIFMV
ncbi:MAG: hypothetical protein KDC74_11980 [Flavobacteriaceae bacterium]|nr:hypothetical protein [Flavobacteriaceae bacterium]